MRFRHSLVIVATAAATLATGCQSKAADPVLATIGARKVTLSAYRTAFQALGPAAQPDTTQPDWAMKLLGDLVNKELMEQEAQRRTPTLDENQARRLHRFAEGQLSGILGKTQVLDKVSVTDADIAAEYARLDREMHAHHILVTTVEEAQQVRSLLASGSQMDTLAASRSIDWDSGKKGGTLGWVKPMTMLESFENGLFSLKPGELSQPVQTRFGWHIIRCDSVRTVTPPPLETAREQIRAALTQQRGLARQEQFTKEMMDEAKPVNVATTVELLNKKFYFELPADKQADPYAKLNAERDIPAFSPDELKLPVVNFADRPALTVQDFNEALSWMPAGVWPSGQGREEVEETLKQILRTKLTREKAIKLGLDKDPQYVSIVKKKENEIRVNSLYYNEIQAGITLSDTDLRNYYETNRKNFVILDRYLASRMESADSTALAKAAADWRAGKPHAAIEAALKAADPQARVTGEVVDQQFMTPKGKEPDLDSVVFAETTNVGDVVGPVWLAQATVGSNGGHWVVLKLLDRLPERFMSYEESLEYVKQQAKASAADEALKKALEGMKQRFPVKINEKALAGLRAQDLAAPATH